MQRERQVFDRKNLTVARHAKDDLHQLNLIAFNTASTSKTTIELHPDSPSFLVKSSITYSVKGSAPVLSIA